MLRFRGLQGNLPNNRLRQSSAVVTPLACASVAPTSRSAPFALAGEASARLPDAGENSETGRRAAGVTSGEPTGMFAAAQAPLLGVILLIAAGCVSQPPLSLDLAKNAFSAPIVGYDNKGACKLTYQVLPAIGPLDRAAVRAVWACTLDWSAVEHPAVGIHGVGGNLRYELYSRDEVVASDEVTTGMMVLGKSYTFSDTLVVPARAARGPLIPRWRLTCRGQTMHVVACGKVSREAE
jgi:hypothetical protein